MDDSPHAHAEPASDPAAIAFKRLEDEVGVVRRLVSANDPSITLGEMMKDVNAMRDKIGTLADRPAMKLTPGNMAAQIAAAGEMARAEDSAAIRQARERIEKAMRDMERLIGTAATIRGQRRRLLWTAGGGLLAGILLWSFLPGTIARTMPERWYLPERMAAHVLHLDRWTAGERLLATADHDHWLAIVFSNSIVQNNQDAIAACLRDAAKESKPARCTVTVRQPKLPSR